MTSEHGTGGEERTHAPLRINVHGFLPSLKLRQAGGQVPGFVFRVSGFGFRVSSFLPALKLRQAGGFRVDIEELVIGN